MYGKTLIVGAAALGSAMASPLLKRQTVVATDSVTAVVTPSDSASTPGVNPTVSMAEPTGDGSDDSYPLYPCPSGYLLTYVQNNATIQRPIGEVKQQVGEWATSVIYPNVSDSEGGSTVGATHTYQALGADFSEVLVNTTANSDDGSAFLQWVANSTAAVTAGDLEIANYSTVFKVYDPLFSQLGSRSNESFVQIFTNACAGDQAGARSALQSLQAMQLGMIDGMRLSDTTTDGNGGMLVSSVVATDTLTTVNTNTAVDTNTVLATSTDDVTQTNTLIPLTTSSTGTTLQETVTPVTVAVTSTAATVENTAATTLVTSDINLETATTVVATSTA